MGLCRPFTRDGPEGPKVPCRGTGRPPERARPRPRPLTPARDLGRMGGPALSGPRLHSSRPDDPSVAIPPPRPPGDPRPSLAGAGGGPWNSRGGVRLRGLPSRIGPRDPLRRARADGRVPRPRRLRDLPRPRGEAREIEPARGHPRLLSPLGGADDAGVRPLPRLRDPG